MRKWVLGCLVVPLLLCVGCVAIAYFAALPRVHDAVSDEVADTLEGKLVRGITAGETSRGRIEIDESELDINNAIGSSVSINVTNNGTEIKGFSTEITPDEILVGADDLIYTAIPTVQDGRIELTGVDSGSGGWSVISLFLPEDAFEQGVEDGINRALEAKGVRPVSVILSSGVMTIETEPVRESA